MKADRLCRTCEVRKDTGEFRSVHARRCLACDAAAPARASRVAPDRLCRCCDARKLTAEFRSPKARRCLDCDRGGTETFGAFEQDGQLMRRCYICREAKPLFEDFYVTQRNPDGTVKRRGYDCKACTCARINAYKEALVATPDGAERVKNWRSTGNRNYRERVRRDPRLYAQSLEDRRIERRLRREQRDGIPVTEQRSGHVSTPPRSGQHLIPVAALAAAVERRVTFDGGDETRIRRQIGIAPRQLYAWRTGEITDVQMDVADRVLIGLDLHWWDVWDGDPANGGSDAERAARAVFEGELVAA